MSEVEERYNAALEELGRRPVVDYEDGALVGVESIAVEPEEAPPTAPPISINIFNHPDSHPVVLGMALLKKYGSDWMLWEPEILEQTIPADFRTSAVSDLTMDKIQAIKTLHAGEEFWERWEVFNWCVQPFSGMYPDFDFVQAPSVGQMMVAVDIARRVRTGVEWSSEVKEFIRQSCRFAGVFCPPEPLDFLEVGTVHGAVDCEKIAELWPDVRRLGRMPTEESILAEQLRRNLEAHLFLKESQARLMAQLDWVLNV